jgi:hypothetical protein
MHGSLLKSSDKRDVRGKVPNGDKGQGTLLPGVCVWGGGPLQR